MLFVNLHGAQEFNPQTNHPTHTHSSHTEVWWRMTGSNRRPPACKAGALPAELIPQDSDALIGGDGGSGWSRTNDPRLIKTVL